jgi:hypothetical protein
MSFVAPFIPLNRAIGRSRCRWPTRIASGRTRRAVGGERA